MLGGVFGRSGLLALAGSMLTVAVASAQGWEPAVQDSKNAAQGCANMPGDDYVCTFVRCDAPGTINFYAAAPGPDITGEVDLDIDGKRFPVTFRSPGSRHLDLTNRADPLPPGFIAALKAGKIMKIRGAGLKAGYDTIPLRNADREIGRVEKVCGITPAATPPATAGMQPQAPDPAKPDPAKPNPAKPDPAKPDPAKPDPADPSETLRRGSAEGAAYCKANLASAPGDLKIGDIEAFCSCMGVNEYAMKSMDEATKALLRPRQQQTCIAGIRKDSMPAHAAAPTQQPTVTPPAPAMPSIPPMAAPAAIATTNRADRLPFEGTWRQRLDNGCQNATIFTRHAIVDRLMGEVESVTRIVKVERKNEMVYNLTIRVEDTLGHGLPTVNKIMRIEIENDNAFNGMGPFYSGQTVAYLRCPDVALPREAAALAAGAATTRSAALPAAPPKAPAKPACGGTFEAQYAKTRQRERQIAGEMGHHMQSTPRAFWNFCGLERERLALAQRTLGQVKACPSAPIANTAQRAALDTIQRVNRSINRPGCT